MRRRPARLSGLVVGGAVGVLLTACGTSGQAGAPRWTPQPTYQVPTSTPQPQLPGSTGPGGGAPASPGAPGGSSGSTAGDPSIVATKLSTPRGLTLLPDGTALVGERTTGRILQVQPKAGQPVKTIRTLTGLDATGDGGLLDLALSPTYAEDGLVFAYVTTPTDNRVIHFTLTGPATPVLTGIPKGRTDNSGRLLFDAAGQLYIGTGDAGTSAGLAGKVLRVDDIGHPAPGNPAPASPVFTTGQRTVDGLCLDDSSGTVFETETRSASSSDEVNALAAGRDYGWPKPTATSTSPAATLPSADAGIAGCAIMNNRLYVASLDGTSVVVAPLTGGRPGITPKVGEFTAAVGANYGRILTVVAAPDGALWLTTSNKDGHGKPVATDDRVIRIFPSASAGGPPV